MVCRECGSRLYVINTQQREDQEKTIRKLVCSKCHRVYMSTEKLQLQKCIYGWRKLPDVAIG